VEVPVARVATATRQPVEGRTVHRNPRLVDVAFKGFCQVLHLLTEEQLDELEFRVRREEANYACKVRQPTVRRSRSPRRASGKAASTPEATSLVGDYERGHADTDGVREDASWGQRRSRHLRILNTKTVEIGSKAVEQNELLGVPLSAFSQDAPANLAKWMKRLSVCGKDVKLVECPDGHWGKRVPTCCNTPPCAFEESETVRARGERGMELMRRLRSGLPFYEVRRHLIEHGVQWKDVPADARRIPSSTRMGWRRIDVNPTLSGILIADLDYLLGEFRSKLARFLRRQGAIAFYISLHVGFRKGHLPSEEGR
jgi:hypothetical protein